MYETTSGVATLPHERIRREHPVADRTVQLLITGKQITDEEADRIIDELSRSFEGSLVRSTEATWLDRHGNLRSGGAVAVEITVEQTGDNQKSQ